MPLIVDYPESLPDMLQMSLSEFEDVARFALASRLYQDGKLSSGIAAGMARMERVEFLMALHHHGLPISNLTDDELIHDIEHA